MIAELSSRRLSQNIYASHCVREGEAKASSNLSIPLYDVMVNAGESLFSWVAENYLKSAKIVVLAGTGNNGGDGFVLARLLHENDYTVSVASINPEKSLAGDALTAFQLWQTAVSQPLMPVDNAQLENADLVIDALLGTGLNGHVSDEYASVIKRINLAQSDVLSVDIPSGLDANTGQVLGVAVKATTTITFVGVKSGLLTGAARNHVGQLQFRSLNIGQAFAEIKMPLGRHISYNDFNRLSPRSQNGHKGNHGRLLCIGGNKGMAGAIRLSAEAALRVGAGLVKVYCHPNNAVQVALDRPELMVTSDNLHQWLSWADCIVFGPGLGQDSWSRETFNQVLSYLIHEKKPVVVDADGLNILGHHLQKFRSDKMIITPHSAEAARMLDTSANDVEQNRYKSAQMLADKYGGACVLKGPGTIVNNQLGMFVCADGNPGMGTAGMGDVLSGALGGLIAQGMDCSQASIYGVCVHSAAADIVAKRDGQRGMIASDLFPILRQLVN